MGGAHPVFAARVVDRRLAADRGIDLGEQRRRHHNEGDVAGIGSGREAREIAYHPAAQGHEGCIASQARLEQAVEDALERGPALGPLAILHHYFDDARARGLERFSYTRCVEGRHHRVRHDGRGAAQMRRVKLDPLEDAGAKMDWVGAAAERYADAFHRWAISSARVRVTAWMLRRPLSITTSAIARYSASRCACRSRNRASGSSVARSGRLRYCRTRSYSSSGRAQRYATVPRAARHR